MNTYTFNFDGLCGKVHNLNIEFEGELSLTFELLELVEQSFLQAKNILDKELHRFVKDTVETFPDKSLLEMIIYYNSNGRYKDIIWDYSIDNSVGDSATITLKLFNPICAGLTAREVERMSFSELRRPLWWENYGMKFNTLGHNSKLVRELIQKKAILKCYYYDKTYYFNIGIEEPNITEDMIEEGVWFSYR